MSFEKRRTFVKTFSKPQFHYCPLHWMFHSRTANNKLNHIHLRALRLVYSDYVSSFDELRGKNRSFSISNRNIQLLSIEICKLVDDLSPSNIKNLYNLNISHQITLNRKRDSGSLIAPGLYVRLTCNKLVSFIFFFVLEFDPIRSNASIRFMFSAFFWIIWKLIIFCLGWIV